MRTSLKLFGMQFDMARRSRRRWLVVTVYIVIGALIACAGLVNQRWPRFNAPSVEFFVPIFVTVLFNSFVFGGVERWGRGLIKPFYGNETLSNYGMEGQAVPGYFKGKYLNDELDLRRRNEAHWRAYRWFHPMISVPWAIAGMKLVASGTSNEFWFSRLVSSHACDLLLFCLLTASICIYLTLPQAVLLWTEPDVEKPQTTS
jgi:hypothetical protein